MPKKETREQRKARWEAALASVDFPSELHAIIKRAFENYSGDIRVFETAVGALFLGFMVGWRPLLLIHSASTVKRYQEILGLKFRDVLPETTGLSDRSPAFEFVQRVGNYWDAVRGTLKVEGRHEVVEVEPLSDSV